MSPLEEIRKKLYQKKTVETKKEAPSVFVEHKEPSEKIGWREEITDQEPEGPIKFRRINFALIFTVFSLVIIAVSGLFIYRWYFSKGTVEVTIQGPETVQNLIPMRYQAIVRNTLNTRMKNAQIVISVPEGASFSKIPSASFLRFSLGDIDINGETKQDFEVIFLGKIDSLYYIDAAVTYELESVSGEFQTTERLDIEVISETAQMLFSLPDRIYIARPFDFTLEVKNLGEETLSNLDLAIKFPADFVLSQSTPEIKDGVVTLDTINPRASSIVSMRGYFRDRREGSRELSADLVLNYAFLKIPIAQTFHQVFLQSFPIFVDIALKNGSPANRGSDYIIIPGDTLEYEITYQNNESVELSDVIIKVALEGAFFDLASVKSNGFFSSLNNTISFTAGNTPELSIVRPHQQGTLKFTVMTKSTYPIAKASDKNFTVKARAEFSTSTIPPDLGIVGKLLTVAAEIENRVSGKLMVVPKAYYYDPTGSFTNTGPLPLRLNQPTTFTVVLQFFSFSDSFSNVTARGFLPEGVTFTGKTAGNLLLRRPLQFNDRTGEIMIDAGKIPENTGLLNNPIEAIFQLSITPSITQLGRQVNLLNSFTVNATNDYTSQGFELKTEQKTSRFEDDSRVGPGIGSVQP